MLWNAKRHVFETPVVDSYGINSLRMGEQLKKQNGNENIIQKQ